MGAQLRSGLGMVLVAVLLVEMVLFRGTQAMETGEGEGGYLTEFLDETPEHELWAQKLHLEREHGLRRQLATSSCANCPKTGAGLSRCFLCAAFVQPKGPYYRTRTCKSAFCAYRGGLSYLRTKVLRPG